MIGSGVVEKLVVLLLGAVWSNRRMLIYETKFYTLNTKSDVRVAFSAVLQLSCGDEYLLIRNLHRPETFAPLGGVVKFLAGGRPLLDSLDFKPQTFGPGNDMINDLRGFLPAKNACKLLRWYQKCEGRESEKDCMIRELKEELGEIGLDVTLPRSLEFRKIRSVIEGPLLIENEGYYQLRVFDVFSVMDHDLESSGFCDQLLRAARGHDNLISVCRNEIINGRSAKNHLISPTSRYLIDGRPLQYTGSIPPRRIP